MSDYRIKITVRNARILRAIEAMGFKSQAEFARYAGMAVTELNALVAMRKSPVDGATGQLRKSAQDLCEALGEWPDLLWSQEQLYEKLLRNTVETEVSAEDMAAALEQKEILRGMIERMPSRRRQLMESRIYKDDTLRDSGKKIGVTQERARQIECRALREMVVTVQKKGKEAEAAVDQKTGTPTRPDIKRAENILGREMTKSERIRYLELENHV